MSQQKGAGLHSPGGNEGQTKGCNNGVINDLLSSFHVLSSLNETFNPYNNPVIRFKNTSLVVNLGFEPDLGASKACGLN